jgi:hypothetical protein
MSRIVDEIFGDVCLDERISDGIFRLGEEAHMNALRDHLIKRGLALEDAITVTNKMLEGKFPERQVYRAEDGILVTFPTPQHKANAMKENPGKYTEKNPIPQAAPKEPAPEPSPPPRLAPSGPAPAQPEPKGIQQGGNLLAIEPPRGPEKPEPPPAPPTPPTTPPNTPERVAAEKAVVKQMINTDDTALTSRYVPPIPESCIKQLAILREHAISRGLKEASDFLSQYVKS